MTVYLTYKAARILRCVWFASMALVTALSLLPKAGPPMIVPLADLWAHGVAYAWLAVLPRLALRRRSFVWAWGMILLGVALEALQGLVPQRTFSMLDMAANALGVCLGVWLGSLARRRAPLVWE